MSLSPVFLGFWEREGEGFRKGVDVDGMFANVRIVGTAAGAYLSGESVGERILGVYGKDGRVELK